MSETKIQDVFRKLRVREEVLTEEETQALFAHLDSLSTRIGGLERMRADAYSEGENAARRTAKSKRKAANNNHTSQVGKQELLQEYGMLYDALKYAEPTDVEDGEAHQIYLNRVAVLASDAASLYEMGVAIGSPLRLSEDEEESDRNTVDAWSEIIQTSLLSNETLLVLTCNDHEEQRRAKSSIGAVLEGMRRGEFQKVPVPQEVIEMEGIIPWSEKPSNAFFHLLLESMGMDSVQKALEQAVQEHPNEGIFREMAGSDFLSDVLARILSPSIYDIYDYQKNKE